MKKEETEKDFKVKSYGKSELASLYMPDVTPKSALEALRKWIDKFPGLKEALAAARLQLHDKRYTPMQVRLITEAIGTP